MKNTFALLLASTSLLATAASAEMLALEKEELTFGFIKLTDMAPLAVAYELGYFEDEGLFVRLEAQANWTARICWRANRLRQRSAMAPKRISSRPSRWT